MNRKTILIGVGVVVILTIIGVACVMGLYSKITPVMYPVAPPMPPVVSQSMNEILAQLEVELKTKSPQVLTNLQPGLSMDRINELERQAGMQLPDDIKAIYHWRNGFNRSKLPSGALQVDGPMPGDCFVPLEEALEMHRDLTNQAGLTAVQRTAFNALAGFTKSWITLFDDGAGDGYFYDPARKPAEGAVFFHFMEDSDYTFFPSPKNLFAGMVKCYQQDAFVWKDGTNGGALSENFNASEKIWREFGVKPPNPE